MAGEIVTKSKRFYCVSIFPDICLTPIGPIMVPIPYNIVGEFSEATGVSPNIRSNGEPVVIHASTVIPTVYGDEAGIGKGIKSKTVGARVQPMEKSSSLSFNGERAVRVGDLVYMNDKNTIGMVFERMPSPPPTPVKKGEPSATLVALGKLVREPGPGLESKAATATPDHEYIPSSSLDLMPGGPLLSTPKSEAIAQARTAHLSPPSSIIGADTSPSIPGEGGGTSRGIVREEEAPTGRWEEVAYGDPSGAVGGGGVELVWVPNAPMSYADQMRKVGRVAWGVPKGLVNGLPEMVAGLAKLSVKWNAISYMSMYGMDFKRSEQIADGIVAKFPSGRIISYNNKEERLGGHFGEVFSPNVYGKAVQLGSRAATFYGSIPDEFGQFNSGGIGSGAKLSFDTSLNAVDKKLAVKAGEILAEDPIARAWYARLQRQGTDVRFVNDRNMREMGLFDPNTNLVTVNLLKHSSAREAVSTVIHEGAHQGRFFRNGIPPGTLFEEYRAFKSEFFFQNSRRPTLLERQVIIDEGVRPLYPHLPDGSLPTLGGH